MIAERVMGWRYVGGLPDRYAHGRHTTFFAPDTCNSDALEMLLATKQNWRFDAATEELKAAVWFERISYAIGYGETFAEAAFAAVCGMLGVGWNNDAYHKIKDAHTFLKE